MVTKFESSRDSIKPEINEYEKWLYRFLDIKFDDDFKKYYDSITKKLKKEVFHDSLITNIINNVDNFNDEYKKVNNYNLWNLDKMEFCIKPFSSFLNKTYRINVLNNDIFPNPPESGWVTPINWFSHKGINDIIRTTIVVKYLDGVAFVIEKLVKFCKSNNIDFLNYKQANMDGYYAGHFYFYYPFRGYDINYHDEKFMKFCIEIQIITQIQETIKSLLHYYYDENRIQSGLGKTDWLWDYKCDQFSANYLGHLLHYADGMIVQVRDRQRKDQ